MNVLEDYMDVMGLMFDEIVEVFIVIIFYNGYFVIIDSEYIEFFK